MHSTGDGEDAGNIVGYGLELGHTRPERQQQQEAAAKGDEDDISLKVKHGGAMQAARDDGRQQQQQGGLMNYLADRGGKIDLLWFAKGLAKHGAINAGLLWNAACDIGESICDLFKSQ